MAPSSRGLGQRIFAPLTGVRIPVGSLIVIRERGMKIWLDDERPVPPEFDVWVKTAAAAMKVLGTGGATEISLDHDLGGEQTGYDVACFLEQGAALGRIAPVKVHIHTANPVGRKNIAAAVAKAMEYWQRDYSANCLEE